MHDCWFLNVEIWLWSVCAMRPIHTSRLSQHINANCRTYYEFICCRSGYCARTFNVLFTLWQLLQQAIKIHSVLRISTRVVVGWNWIRIYCINHSCNVYLLMIFICNFTRDLMLATWNRKCLILTVKIKFKIMFAVHDWLAISLTLPNRLRIRWRFLNRKLLVSCYYGKLKQQLKPNWPTRYVEI